MDKKRVKKIGSREEVYNGSAFRTSGGLTKDDIILKVSNGKNYYVSKKLSAIAKERDMFSKYKPKRKTKGNVLRITSRDTDKLTKKNISFILNKNKCKKYYYPELASKNITRLRQENEDEDEDEEDDEELVHTPKDFQIEDISSINL